MRRREFIAGLGGAAAWPLLAQAQQRARPVVGHLSSGAESESVSQSSIAAFGKGLNEQGYVVGRNVEILSRWSEGQPDRLPALAADLAQRRVAVIFAEASNATVLAAKSATPTIPVVFVMGADPVELGLVASLNKPGGNLTGATFLNEDLTAKRLELLHEIIPAVTSLGYFVNPITPRVEKRVIEAEAAGRTLGVRLVILNASTATDIEGAFASLSQQGIDAISVGSDLLFEQQRHQLVALAARYSVPTIYGSRLAVEDGGLMSYGTADQLDLYRVVGTYVARILKGEKPSELPVQRSTRFETALNLKTAKALGIEVPTVTLLRATEVIE